MLFIKQNNNFREIPVEECPKIKSEYRRHLQRIMCNDFFKTDTMPDVDNYLDDPDVYHEKEPTRMLQITHDIKTGDHRRPGYNGPAIH